ncbi:MAG: metallophosphatase family protein [Gemmataceae bacterium]|nr:metallophosphatase family protein [Gemmataceae bacterium]
MRVLIVSDLHANWPALEALREPHDVCLCLGDLVDYGCDPAPVIDWVRRHVHACVRGNHDHMVAQYVTTNGYSGFRYLSGVTRPVSQQRIEAEHRRFLADLPLTRFLTLGGKRFLLVHATPRDPLDEYAAADVDFWKRRIAGLGVDVVCVGHTHQPYVLQVEGTTIINPGSVGLPRDGDPRLSYAVWEDGRVTLHRAEYDVEQAVRRIQEADLPDQAKEMLACVLRHGSLHNGSQRTAPAPASNGTHSR